MKKWFGFVMLLGWGIVGCSRSQPLPPPTVVPEMSSPIGSEGSTGDTGQIETNILPAAPATAPPLPTATPTWPPPVLLDVPAPVRQPSVEELETANQLAIGSLPERDDVALVTAYGRLNGPLPTGIVPLEPAPIVGTVYTFSVLNFDDNTISPVEARLEGVGEHAYFWFDLTVAPLDQAQLSAILTRFDQIYRQSIDLFGPERRPGIDGDVRVHVVNISPRSLCSSASGCGLAGYFSAADGLPAAVVPYSNQREMFVMNADLFGGRFYEGVLGHELRHMIEENYDKGDADWLVEGTAMLAEVLLGYDGEAQARANQFLQNPDQQLTAWTEGNALPFYGQAFLFNRYLYQRLGLERYRAVVNSPLYGFQALDAAGVQDEKGPVSGKQLWLDWLVAQVLHRQPNVPARYVIGDMTIGTARTEVLGLPVGGRWLVHQFGADYYRIDRSGPLEIEFRGDSLVQLLPEMPASGQFMWLANRANYSDARLTRQVDLTGVSRATLSYEIYHDIELGYDFAYVALSRDGGRTWVPLAGDHMQGDEPAHDPANAALSSRFYTGQSEGWVTEHIDLTPYVGQPVLLRFQYVTDPILTGSGLAIDNIMIPEAHFYDDGETLAEGWVAEGFVRATAYIPQEWDVILITQPAGGGPQILSLPLQNGQLMTTVDLPESVDGAVLVVAASSPMTLTEAQYEMRLR